MTVSTGHVLHYKSEFRADGYSLGGLLYSLALAPGQKKIWWSGRDMARGIDTLGLGWMGSVVSMKKR